MQIPQGLMHRVNLCGDDELHTSDGGLRKKLAFVADTDIDIWKT